MDVNCDFKPYEVRSLLQDIQAGDATEKEKGILKVIGLEVPESHPDAKSERDSFGTDEEFKELSQRVNEEDNQISPELVLYKYASQANEATPIKEIFCIDEESSSH